MKNKKKIVFQTVKGHFKILRTDLLWASRNKSHRSTNREPSERITNPLDRSAVK